MDSFEAAADAQLQDARRHVQKAAIKIHSSITNVNTKLCSLGSETPRLATETLLETSTQLHAMLCLR